MSPAALAALTAVSAWYQAQGLPAPQRDPRLDAAAAIAAQRAADGAHTEEDLRFSLRRAGIVDHEILTIRSGGSPGRVLTELDRQAGLPGINPYGDYLFPTTRYRLPLVSAYYGMALLTDSYDQSFVDLTRVYLEGNADSIDPDVPDDDMAVYHDELNGRRYVAYKTTEDGSVPDIAFELVKQADDLADEYRTLSDLRDGYNNSELQYVAGKIELLRLLQKSYGDGSLAAP